MKAKNKIQVQEAVRSLTFTIFFVSLSLFLISCTTKPPAIETKADAFKSLNDQVRSVITDPTRTSEILELLAQLEKVFIRVIEERIQLRQDFASLNSDYDAPREAFVTLKEEAEKSEDAHRQEISEIRAGLVRAITAEEWELFAKSKSVAINAAFEALQTGN